MAEWTQQNIPDYETENITPVLEKLDAEVDLIYGHLGTLRTMQAAASDPADPINGLVYLNTTTLAVRRWNGSSWDTIVSPLAYGSGVTLDDSVLGLSRNVLLRRTDTGTTVAIAASATVPAVLELNGDLLINTTSTPMTSGHSFAGAAAGWYVVYAERDGSTANFLLKRGASDFTPAATQRIIAHVYTTGTEINPIRNLEVRTPQLNEALEYAFHAQRGNALQTFTSTAAVLATNFEHYDRDAVHASGVFTAPIAGWYEFNVIARGNGAVVMSVTLRHNNTTDQAYDTGIIAKLFNIRLYLDAGDTMRPYVSAASSVANVTVTPFDNAFWGRWIGNAV